jgi:3-oxoacyl-[acyl-carrier protein] reductase
MGDRYASFAHTGPGRALVRRLGLPEPPQLHRYRPGEPLVSGPVLVGAAAGGRLGDLVGKTLTAAGVDVVEPGASAPGEPPDRVRLHAGLVFDATGITDLDSLQGLYDFFHPYLRSLYPSGRVLVLGLPPAVAGGLSAVTAQRALEGFTRSLAKEVGRGGTASLLQVAPGAEGNLESTLRFLLSARSAYVSGQVIALAPAPVVLPADWERPLAGKLALVTGAAGGIGAATARVLARDGAQVVAVDLAAAGDALAAVANEIGGTAQQLDLSTPQAPQRLAEHMEGRYGRLDILVHNAGITRDRTLPKLPRTDWRAVLELNLVAVQRSTEALLATGLIPDGGRLVVVSSVSGLAGNRGQTNYATAKAGLVGLVQGLAPEVAGRGITANAVAPGFIETRLTAAMPRLPREVGRRMNSLAQAGLPVDVAETISWLASPGSAAVNGQVVRVCGQSLLGA